MLYQLAGFSSDTIILFKNLNYLIINNYRIHKVASTQLNLVNTHNSVAYILILSLFIHFILFHLKFIHFVSISFISF